MSKYKSSEVQKLIDGEVTSLVDLFLASASRILEVALQAEVEDYLTDASSERDRQGRRLVTRNGQHPRRKLATPVGQVELEQPRVNDRRPGRHFESGLLPKYRRRVQTIDTWIPTLYLKGIPTTQFKSALRDVLGADVSGLSPTSISRLKEVWSEEFEQWQRRSLKGKRYVYLWADAIYFKVRMTPEKPCALVLIGATDDGRKELVAIQDGQRESTLSWRELLLDLRARGLTRGPRLAVADGAIGFWAALNEVYPETQEQRCWVHKTANLLNKLPKRDHAEAKKHIQAIYGAPCRAEAEKAWEAFLNTFGANGRVRACLVKDRDMQFAFYDFPKQHWIHLRSTNVIESTFGTVRHRTRQTKGCLSQRATMAMVYKLAIEAEKNWQSLHSAKLAKLVADGASWDDGVIKAAA